MTELCEEIFKKYGNVTVIQYIRSFYSVSASTEEAHMRISVYAWSDMSYMIGCSVSPRLLNWFL